MGAGRLGYRLFCLEFRDFGFRVWVQGIEV